jgi:hypothetical protein
MERKRHPEGFQSKVKVKETRRCEKRNERKQMPHPNAEIVLSVDEQMVSI